MKQGRREKNNKKKKKAAASVQRRPTFSSSHLHIRFLKKEKFKKMKNKKRIQNPCSIFTVPSLKVPGGFPDLPPAARRRNNGRGRRRPRRPCGRGFLHLCSPLSLQRGKSGWRGNSRPSRAAVSRIQAGRFCIWCLMSCGGGESGRGRKVLIGQYRAAADEL